jgi:hypothetical protein
MVLDKNQYCRVNADDDCLTYPRVRPFSKPGDLCFILVVVWDHIEHPHTRGDKIDVHSEVESSGVNTTIRT